MLAATDRLEFVPPPTPGFLRALGLAVLAHAFLMAALTWGVHWRREAVTVSVEAELWSALPQQAAPRPVEDPPLAVPAATTVPEPVPVQPEPLKVDIALEQQKLKLKKQRERELELKHQQELKQEKQLLEKKRLQEKVDHERKLAEEKKKAELDRQRKEVLRAQQEAQKVEAQRTDRLKQLQSMAGASGGETSTGTALKSSGPSASYKGRIAAYFKEHKIGYLGQGNPKVVVSFSTIPDGTVIGKSLKIIERSGVKAWDDAVLRALEIAVLPRDTDGRVPPYLELGLSPNDF